MGATNIDTKYVRTSTSASKQIENVISIEEGTVDVPLQNWNKNDIILIQDSLATLQPLGGQLYTDYLEENFVVTIRQHGAVPPASFLVGVYDPVSTLTEVYSLDVDLTISINKGEVLVAGNKQ